MVVIKTVSLVWPKSIFLVNVSGDLMLKVININCLRQYADYVRKKQPTLIYLIYLHSILFQPNSTKGYVILEFLNSLLSIVQISRFCTFLNTSN